jgi:hypothetical protein
MLNLTERERLLVLRALCAYGEDCADNQDSDVCYEVVKLANEIAHTLPEGNILMYKG